MDIAVEAGMALRKKSIIAQLTKSFKLIINHQLNQEMFYWCM